MNVKKHKNTNTIGEMSLWKGMNAAVLFLFFLGIKKATNGNYRFPSDTDEYLQ